MIGELPTSLNVGGKDIQIQTDYRIALIIFQALNDPDLSKAEKAYIMLDALYGIDHLDQSRITEAMGKASWFLNGGQNEDQKRKHQNDPRLVDWQKDEQMIFSSVNRIAGKELRTVSYCHWWTFLGYFNEIQEGLFSTVLGIRSKKARHKKLDDWEKDYYSRNKDLIDIQEPLTKEEKAYKEALNAQFK